MLIPEECRTLGGACNPREAYRRGKHTPEGLSILTEAKKYHSLSKTDRERVGERGRVQHQWRESMPLGRSASNALVRATGCHEEAAEAGSAGAIEARKSKASRIGIIFKPWFLYLRLDDLHKMGRGRRTCDILGSASLDQGMQRDGLSPSHKRYTRIVHSPSLV